MKNILTLLLICLCSSYVFSQEKWGSYNGSIAGTHFGIIEACGDSIELSDGNWFEKMHVTVFGSTSMSAGRKVVGDSVYFKFSLIDNSAPILLYDYSVEVGDTINGNWGVFVVSEVDTEFAIGKDRKRITMESTYDGRIDIWLSGLGSKISGYLQPGAPIFAPDAGSEFSCYLDVDSGEFYYGDKDPDLCMLDSITIACMTTSTDVIEYDDEINIFPNPASDFITISIDNSNHKSINTRLFSMDGKSIVAKNYNADNSSMDVSRLEAGIYFFEVNQNGNKSYHKIVIQ